MDDNPYIKEMIEKLERRRLDGIQPSALPIWGQLDATSFVRIDGLATFWKEDELCRFEQYMEDLITGCHGQGQTFAYLLLGHRNTVKVYVGMQGAKVQLILGSALRGAFPDIELTENNLDKIGSELNGTPSFNHFGRLTGVPTLKTANTKEREGRVQQIERLIRGLYGEEWGYLVLGRPVEQKFVLQMAYSGLNEIRNVSGMVKQNVQVSQGVTAEHVDRQAQYCVELLERNLERLDRGKAQGMWQVDVHLFAANESTLTRAKSLCNAIFAGSESTPEPVRAFTSVDSVAATADHFSTLLNTSELAILAQLPREEMPGYAIRDYARFDLALPVESDSSHLSPSETISIGKIMNGSAATGNLFAVPKSDFAKHGLIVGVTGSGKTNTIFHILHRLWAKGQGVPFLVIEPAKAEYRDLRTVSGFEGLRIFTLGDERLAPFRLNPFEFEIGDSENRIHVQTHIDYLKSVFNAAFILYAPMPYVLETCLHEIYQDRGWDLTTSKNRRLPQKEQGHEAKWPVFPTLSDLYRKVDEVVDRLGYEERIQMDVKAGLKARIGSLRLGGKGLMLDVRHSVPMKDLLAHPTVLELERIGNDDEKAFVIGLLFTRIYEYRMLEARRSSGVSTLRHVTVIEEAHRLLKNVRTDVGTEEANVKGQAVESFANMLSEIRAYGQGILIAEQIPAKLAPDAIKNTNLKVLHRVVAADDREAMGGAMNMDETQKRYVTTLRTGQAAVYAEGADHPYLVEVLPFKNKSVKGRLTDRQVYGAMRQFCSQVLYEPLPGYAVHIQSRLAAPGVGGSDVRDMALSVLGANGFGEIFAGYFLSIIEEPRQAILGYNALVKFADRLIRPKVGQTKSVEVYVMLQAVTELLEDRGRRNNWFYNVVEKLRSDLTAILSEVILQFENRQDILDGLIARHDPALAAFVNQYRQLCSKSPAPYTGCAFCTSRCLYRYEVAPLVADKALARDFVETIRNTRGDDAMWCALAIICSEAAGRVLPGISKPAVIHGVAICFASQMGAAQGLSSASQHKLVNNVKEALRH